jgi:hypothetical protein
MPWAAAVVKAEPHACGHAGATWGGGAGAT